MKPPIEKRSPAPRVNAGNQAGIPTNRIHHNTRLPDFDTLNLGALAMLPAVLVRILPGSKIIAGEYVMRNPKRADRYEDSFKINLRRGRWSDFAFYIAICARSQSENQGRVRVRCRTVVPESEIDRLLRRVE